MPRSVRLFPLATRLAVPTSLVAFLLALTACEMPGGGDRALEAALPRRSVDLAPSTSVSWFEAGEPTGTPVVYLHGTPGSAGAWAWYLLEPVPGSWSVAPDRPGYGASSPGRAVPGLADQAAALGAVIGAVGGSVIDARGEDLQDTGDPGHGPRNPVLVGHSLGAPIAAWYAAANPDAVAALVLLGGSMDPSLEKIHPLQRLADAPPLSWLLPDLLRVANEELLPLEDELETLSSVLERVTCPVVIVHGTDDGLVPYANVAYMERAFTGSARVEVVTLPGEGHFLPWEHEALVREVIGAVVRGDAASGP